MAKTLFCFICKKPVEVSADEAIAVLCPEHKTKENLEIMSKKTPTKQLHAIQDEGLQIRLEENKEAVEIKINKLTKELERVKRQLTKLPKGETIVETAAPEPDLSTRTVNEYGELI